jgi:hypothetical protein
MIDHDAHARWADDGGPVHEEVAPRVLPTVECHRCHALVGTYNDGAVRLETHGRDDDPCPSSRLEVVENEEAFSGADDPEC